MAGQQPARSGAGETISEFMARRRREVADRVPRARAAHEAYGKALRNARGFHVGHPGFAESLIPVWGSAREAIADEEDGNAVGAAFNTALALSDLSVAGAGANAVRKAAFKSGLKGALFVLKGAVGDSAKATAWKSVRKKMGVHGLLEKYQHGHHWLIPQRWKDVPEFVRNHPLNIKAMPSEEVHGRVHGRYKGQPQFGLLGQYWRGTPHWSKAATGSVVGRPVAATARKDRR
jgi:hypothetical protein